MNRRKFIISSASTLGVAALPFSARLAFSQSLNTFTFMTPMTLSLAFAPVLYPSASGIFEELDLNVKVEVGRGAGQVIQLAAANQIESGRTGGANYMAARAQDNSDVIAFATIAQKSPFVIISSEENPVSTPQELEGKTIGMASFGGSMEATLNLMLAKEGIDPTTIKKERVTDGPSSFAMVEAGRIEAFFGNVSTVSRLRAENLPLYVMNVDDGVPGQVYIGREELINDHEAEYTNFLKGVRKGVEQLLQMDDDQLIEAIRTIAEKYDVPGIEKENIALSDLKGNRELWVAQGEENILRNVPELWEHAQSLLISAGSMKETDRVMYTNKIWEASLD